MRLYEAFGERKTLKAWSIDPRCFVVYEALVYRVRVRGQSIEQAFALRARTSRRLDRLITAWGESKTAAEWARDPRSACNPSQIPSRISRGIAPEQAISLTLSELAAQGKH